ncbi:hypothetical protein ACH4U7_51945 [Streptomyces sp. NPDC020845]|uniref:hypothetical protein n=1 Tax=Streptomyces sp. NPDC020845 TaxID=3365096 RepID=UPI0037A9C8A8
MVLSNAFDMTARSLRPLLMIDELPYPPQRSSEFPACSSGRCGEVGPVPSLSGQGTVTVIVIGLRDTVQEPAETA